MMIERGLQQAWQDIERKRFIYHNKVLLPEIRQKPEFHYYGWVGFWDQFGIFVCAGPRSIGKSYLMMKLIDEITGHENSVIVSNIDYRNLIGPNVEEKHLFIDSRFNINKLAEEKYILHYNWASINVFKDVL